MIDDKDDWFQTLDEVLFAQKHITYNLINQVEDYNKSRSSRSSSKKSGRISKKSSISSKNKLSRNFHSKKPMKGGELEEK